MRRYIGVLCPIGVKDRVSGLMWIAPHKDAIGVFVWGREVEIYSSSPVQGLNTTERICPVGALVAQRATILVDHGKETVGLVGVG